MTTYKDSIRRKLALKRKLIDQEQRETIMTVYPHCKKYEFPLTHKIIRILHKN